MQEGSRVGLVEALRCANRGEGTFRQLADALGGIDGLVVILPPSDMARWLTDLGDAVEEKGYGSVKWSDAATPRTFGHKGPDGATTLCAFSDADLAAGFAVNRGLMEPGAALPFTTRSAIDLLAECLVGGHAGLVLDDDTDHRVLLNRRSLSRVYALMKLESFARAPSLHVVMHHGQLLIERPQQRPEMAKAFAFDSKQLAQYGIQLQGKRVGNEEVAGLTARAAPTRETLEEFLRSGVNTVVVNAGLPLEHWYEHPDLVRMIDLLGGDGHAERPASDTAGTVPQSPRLTPVQWALRFPHRPPWPPPGRSEKDAAAAVARLEGTMRHDGPAPAWERVDQLAFDLDLHVPVHHGRIDGLIWPQYFNHFLKQGKTLTSAYSSASLARAFEPGQLLHLSAIEAMRWAWAAPSPIDDLAVDFYQDSPAWFTVPNFWVLSAIYPQFVEIDDLDRVADVSLTRLSSSVGARGLKAEVVKALVNGWSRLWELQSGDGRPVEVQHGAGTYLAAFTDPERCLAFGSSHVGSPGSTASAAEEPPFGRWLILAAGCDGVVLDPDGEAPLVLDHTDLVFLEAWVRGGGRQPRMGEVIERVSELAEAGELNDVMAGRIAADWPRYFVGIERMTGGGAQIMTLPDLDCCPIFTSGEAAQVYINVFRTMGLMGEGMQPVPVLHRWTYSAFHEARSNFADGLCIDPVPMGTGGLYVSGPRLEAALERIDENLKPRVPNFAREAAA